MGRYAHFNGTKVFKECSRIIEKISNVLHLFWMGLKDPLHDRPGAARNVHDDFMKINFFIPVV